jgi:two-component system response regulator (stage 0 sporulation protein A)
MSKYRALIAEINPDYGPLLSRYLAGAPGLTIVGVAYDGEEALRQVIETQPDFLILSASMMSLLGYEVLERIPPAVMPRWIIVTSANGEGDKYVQMCLARGAQKFALKGYPRLTALAMLELLREHVADLESKKRRFRWLSDFLAKCSRLMRPPVQILP